MYVTILGENLVDISMICLIRTCLIIQYEYKIYILLIQYGLQFPYFLYKMKLFSSLQNSTRLFYSIFLKEMKFIGGAQQVPNLIANELGIGGKYYCKSVYLCISYDINILFLEQFPSVSSSAFMSGIVCEISRNPSNEVFLNSRRFLLMSLT